MEKEKTVYLISVTQEQYEPCIDFDDYDIDSLPTVATYVHESYEEARQHAVEIISNEYPMNVYYLFHEPAVDDGDDDDYEPELEYGDFCTLEENPEASERFVFKFGYAGNNVGPCMCIQCAEFTKITITEKNLLP